MSASQQGKYDEIAYLRVDNQRLSTEVRQLKSELEAERNRIRCLIDRTERLESRLPKYISSVGVVRITNHAGMLDILLQKVLACRAADDNTQVGQLFADISELAEEHHQSLMALCETFKQTYNRRVDGVTVTQ